MKRKELAALLGLSVLSVSLTGCSGNKITQTKTDTQIEVGTECNINVGDYFTLGSKVNVSDIQVDTSSVDTNTVGDYIVNVIYDNNTYNINVSVVDTTAPTITAKSDIEAIERGTEIKPSDYVDIKDASAYSAFFVTEDGDMATLLIPEDLDASVSEINYTIVAVDKSDNRSNEVSVTIPIKASTITLSEDSFKFEFEQFLLENGVTDWTKWKPFVDSLSDEDRQKITDKYFEAIVMNDDQIDYIKDYWCFIMDGGAGEYAESHIWAGGYDDNGMRISTITESTWTEYKKNHGITDWSSFKNHIDSLGHDELINVGDNLSGTDGLTAKELFYVIHVRNPEVDFNESEYDKNGNWIDPALSSIQESKPSQPSTPSQPSAPACNCIQFIEEACVACQQCICY